LHVFTDTGTLLYTVDGKNSAPVGYGKYPILHDLPDFMGIPGGFSGFLNHQQYVQVFHGPPAP